MDSEYLTIRAAVTVPALQALVSGAFYGGATAGLVGVANSLDLLDLPPLAVGGAVGCLAGIAAWRGLLADWRALLYGLEPETQPAQISEPETVRIDLFSDNGRKGQFANLPASPEQLIELGKGIAAGDSFSVARWTGAHGIFSRGEFEALRGELLKLGWLAWRSDRSNAQGIEITRAGGAVFRHFASMSQSPTLRIKR